VRVYQFQRGFPAKGSIRPAILSGLQRGRALPRHTAFNGSVRERQASEGRLALRFHVRRQILRDLRGAKAPAHRRGDDSNGIAALYAVGRKEARYKPAKSAPPCGRKKGPKAVFGGLEAWAAACNWPQRSRQVDIGRGAIRYALGRIAKSQGPIF